MNNTSLSKRRVVVATGKLAGTGQAVQIIDHIYTAFNNQHQFLVSANPEPFWVVSEAVEGLTWLIDDNAVMTREYHQQYMYASQAGYLD